MIIDLKKFISAERPYWDELAGLIGRLDSDPDRRMGYDEIQRLYYLYQRASADLAKISTFSAEKTIREYLESLVGRAYAAIHTAQGKSIRFAPVKWFCGSFPRTFRRHWHTFVLTLLVFTVGGIFGGAALLIDPDAKAVLLPFEHLQGDPSERVAMEERVQSEKDRSDGAESTFSAYLMTHNTRVSILVLALGMTWGLGTIILLFFNGVILGAVAADYITHGQTAFLCGWLLPHGVVEIPAILIAGQAGLILAGALLGYRSSLSMGERLRRMGPDLVNLIGGVAVMLVWAGIIEAFFSQVHEPVLPYSVKIAFGVLEFGLLISFLGFAGKRDISSRQQRRR